MPEKSGSGSIPYDESVEKIALRLKNAAEIEDYPLLTPFYTDTTTLIQEGDSVFVEDLGTGLVKEVCLPNTQHSKCRE
jgi:hypothetical protein